MILVGTIIKPQGIKGEVKVKGFVDSSSDFQNFKYIYLDNIKTKILSCRILGEEIFLYLEKVFSRDDAEKLRGKELFLPREDLDLDDDRVLICDCIGCQIVANYGENQKIIGTLQDIWTEYSTEIYVVNLPNGKNAKFPNVKNLVEKFDIDNKKIYLCGKLLDEVICDED